MAVPITPQFMADTVVLQTLSVSFNAVWDGANWILTPADIILRGFGNMSADGTPVTDSDIELAAPDLPPAGISALQDLYDFIEQEMAVKYG